MGVPPVIHRPAMSTGSALVGPGLSSGSLVADPDGILDLARGFSYDIVAKAGDPLKGKSSGVTPGRPDGAAAYPGKWGRTFLVQNHEQVGGVAAPELTYDPGAEGGATTLLIDRCNQVLSGCVSLAGTCALGAGGATPWGTWLTGEATEQKAGGALTRDHGYVFEVSPYHPEANHAPEPLVALGRFAHAAVVADPVRGHLYLTEAAGSPDGLLYRCTPRTRRNGLHTLLRGGLLEALVVPGVPDLSACHRLGTELPATWKPVPDPSAATVATREQFADGDVTRIPGRTGAWWGTTRGTGGSTSPARAPVRSGPTTPSASGSGSMRSSRRGPGPALPTASRSTRGAA